jgi:phage shock protein B
METLAILFMVVVLPLWIIFHHTTKWKDQKSLSADDEHMLEDLWRSAKRMESRIVSLEAILDAEQPDWRKNDAA